MTAAICVIAALLLASEGLFEIATGRPLGPRVALKRRQRAAPWPPAPDLVRRRGWAWLACAIGYLGLGIADVLAGPPAVLALVLGVLSLGSGVVLLLMYSGTRRTEA